MAGARLGPYEIVAPLGAGGMGEVYRARDTKLNRDVAIKVLLPAVANDLDRLARFSREAQVLASLNHSNIAHIHGLEEADGITALVLELVEGEDLAQRIARGPIPIDEVLPIARQIAEALEAAHEQGIIHRDLKPANIKIRPDGTVKVLDFGLAKAMDPAGASRANAMNSPTLSMHATQAGIILGTAAYMSPEQARGKTVDRRTDIWAFGCVLFEMVTGARAFPGDDATDTIVSVVSRDPDWNALPPGLAAGIRRLLRRCLEKDSKRRLDSASGVRIEIDEALTEPAQEVNPAAAGSREMRTPPVNRWIRLLPWSIALGSAIALIAFTLAPGGFRRRGASVPALVSRFAMVLPEGQRWSSTRGAITVSPDGRQIVYSADRRLYLRSLADFHVKPITGIATGAESAMNPIFSSDGGSIAYWEQGDGTIKKIALSGGAPVTVCQIESLSGMSWAGDTIFLGQGTKGIMRVSANGGTPELVSGVNAGEFAHSPQLLPDGQTLLFTLATGTNTDRWDKARIVSESLSSHERKTLIDGGADARYLPTGHLVYALNGVVFAVPFDLKRQETSGSPVPIAEGVGRTNATAQLVISETGTLIYIPGPVSTTTGQLGVGLFDRRGGSKVLSIQPGPYQVPRLSPDAKRIAIARDDGKEASIWIYDLSGTTSMRRLTFEGQGHNRFPIWSADGQRVAFQSDRDGASGIFWQRADGAGTAERLTKGEEGAWHIPESWSPDGEHFLYSVGKSGATSLWVFSLKDKMAARFDAVESPATTLTGAVFSPDGRWVAYASREGRRFSAIYVQPSPPTGAKYQISKDADDAHHPVWSRNGAELLFVPGPGSLLNAIPIDTHQVFTAGEATSIQWPFHLTNPAAERSFDVSRDGEYFLGLIDAGTTPSGGPAAVPQINVVLNWFEELKQRVPAR